MLVDISQLGMNVRTWFILQSNHVATMSNGTIYKTFNHEGLHQLQNWTGETDLYSNMLITCHLKFLPLKSHAAVYKSVSSYLHFSFVTDKDLSGQNILNTIAH